MIRYLTIACILLWQPLAWGVTYSYQGEYFDSVITGVSYTTGMRVTGSFSTASPLQGDLVLKDIGPNGLDLVVDWSFSDGVSTYTSNNAYIVPAVGSFNVSTDSDGAITDFRIGVLSPSPPPIHEIGTPVSGIFLSSGGGDVVAMGAPCWAVYDGHCVGANGAAATSGAASASRPGIITIGAVVADLAAVPMMSNWAGLALSLLLVLAVASRLASGAASG